MIYFLFLKINLYFVSNPHIRAFDREAVHELMERKAETIEQNDYLVDRGEEYPSIQCFTYYFKFHSFYDMIPILSIVNA